MKKIFRVLTAISLFANIIVTPTYASAEILSDTYTVGDGYILGVEGNTGVTDFLTNIGASAAATVTDSDGNTRTGSIQSGDKVTADGNEYTIYTKEFNKHYYANDDFDDGTLGSWTRTAGTADNLVVQDGQLTFKGNSSGTVDVKARRSVSVTDSPKLITEEVKMTIPKQNNTRVQFATNNNINHNTGINPPTYGWLSVMRIATNDKNYKLNAMAYPSAVLGLSDITVGTEYTIKNVTNTSTGKVTTYVDGNKITVGNEDTYYAQAKNNKDKNSAIYNEATNYIPTYIEIEVSKMSDTDAGLKLDYYKMYEADTLNVGKIGYTHNGTASTDMRSVPVDMPEIKIDFMTDNGEIDADSVLKGVKLLDKDNNEVQSSVSFDSNSCKLVPSVLLDNNASYTIDISNVKDSVSGCTFSKQYKLKTDSNVVPIALVSATAKCGDESYDDISSVKKNIDSISLKFMYQSTVSIDEENIGDCFDLVDKNGKSMKYTGSYDPTNKTYTFTLGEELVSGESYKLKINELTDKTSGVSFSKTIDVRAVGSSVIDTDKYTVGDGFIMGVAEDTTVSAFLNNLVCLGTPVVYAGATTTKRANSEKIQNGDTVKVSGKTYTVETSIYPNKDIFFDNATNGYSSWGGGTVINDSEKGKVLSASSALSRSVSVSELPEKLIFEFDVRYPDLPTSGSPEVMMRNSGADPKAYMATLRLAYVDGVHILRGLYSGGYTASIVENVEANTWYHLKYEMDTATGLCDIYVNDSIDPAISGSAMQASTSSPLDLKPTVIKISSGVQIGNIELYSPTAVRVESITANRGESKLNVLEQLPSDIDSLKVKLSCGNQIDTASLANGIALYDNSGSKVDCDITVNSLEPSYTIKPKVMLKNNSTYTVKLSGIKDTVYKAELNKEYKISTNTKTVGARVYSVTAKSGTDEYDSVSSIRTDTDAIDVKLVFADGTTVTEETVKAAADLYDEATAVSTGKSFNTTTNTLSIGVSGLVSGKNYTLKINDLKDASDNTILNYTLNMKAVAPWVVEAGELLQSDEYSISDGEVSGIQQGTTAGELLASLKTIPGTSAVIYTNSSKTSIQTGALTDGNIIEVTNTFTNDTKTYSVTLNGMKLKSDKWNVTDGKISGITDGIPSSEFLDGLTLYGVKDAKVLNKSNAEASEVKNGYTLKLTSTAGTVSYKLETINNDDTVYLNNTFEESTESWTSGTVTDDDEKGKVLSYVISGATTDEKKSASAKQTSFTIEDEPEILVFEADFKLPVLPKSAVNIQTRNAANELLEVARIDDKEKLFTLFTGNGTQTLQEGMSANKWYNIKFVNNCTTGTTDIYLDGKLMAEGLRVQGKTDFIPASLEISVGATSVNGTVLSLDNVKMYQPNPIKTAYIDTVTGAGKSADITSVPINVDKINVHLSVAGGYEIKNEAAECVTLVDKGNNEIPSVYSYDEATSTVTIAPKEILEADSDYTVKINGITDDIYQKSYNDSFTLHTSDFGFDMTNAFAMDNSGDRLNGFINGNMSVHIPFVNLQNQKNVMFMLVTFDADDRMMTCTTAEMSAMTAQLTEAIFNLDLSGFAGLPSGARVFTREENGGPLTKAYEVRISD